MAIRFRTFGLVPLTEITRNQIMRLIWKILENVLTKE